MGEMSEQAVPQGAEQDVSTRQTVAMVISVLLFVTIYLAGFVAGVMELANRPAQE